MLLDFRVPVLWGSGSFSWALHNVLGPKLIAGVDEVFPGAALVSVYLSIFFFRAR